MTKETFSRREVERSFRKFNDVVSDLNQATFQTWGNFFGQLIDHCENDPVMRAVTEPLRNNPRVDADKWYAENMASMKGMVGSARYAWPLADEDRTALLYKFLLKANKGEVDFRTFCIANWGASKYQEMVRLFNQELVFKFTRQVSYRLDEITQDLGDATEVRREAMLVFHIHDNTGQDHSMNFHGNVQGANIAGTGATISDSSATYNNNAELAAALKALKPLVGEVVAEQRQAVEAALDSLVEATRKDVPVAMVAPAVETLAKASPTLGERLNDIGSKIGLSLVASSIFQAIKSHFGIH